MVNSEEKIKKESGGKLFIIIIALLIFIFAFMGISFAAFTYTKKKDSINTISTGNVYLNYTEDNNGINITDAMPITDSIGKTLNDENYYFDFSVEGKFTGGLTADYEISAEKMSTSTLSNDEVKLYLEKQVNNSYEEIMSPQYFTPLKEKTNLGTMAGNMLLDKGKLSNESKINYRLRMWVADNAVIGEFERSFGIKVSIKAKVDLQD